MRVWKVFWNIELVRSSCMWWIGFSSKRPIRVWQERWILKKQRTWLGGCGFLCNPMDYKVMIFTEYHKEHLEFMLVLFWRSELREEQREMISRVKGFVDWLGASLTSWHESGSVHGMISVMLSWDSALYLALYVIQYTPSTTPDLLWWHAIWTVSSRGFQFSLLGGLICQLWNTSPTLQQKSAGTHTKLIVNIFGRHL